jgi:hypothetical protein
MSLKLGKLQKAASQVVLEEKSLKLLSQELVRSLGPTIVTSYGLKVMAESANDRLDVMERLGRSPEPVSTAILLKFSDSSLKEVRKLVARLVPSKLLVNFVNDKDSSVRATVARRLPSHIVKEMKERHPGDDQLLSIYREKKLNEGIKLLDDKHFDMYGDLRMGDAEEVEHPGLTDAWYDSMSRKIIASYGGNLERQWEESAVNRFCNSLKSQGVEVDPVKLLDSVYDHLSKRDKRAMDESASFDVDFMPIFEEPEDNPVKKLVEGKTSPNEFVKTFEDIFKVVKTTVENPGRKLGIMENISRVTLPAYCTIPTRGLGVLEEKALDAYARHWSSMQRLSGSAYKMSWTPHRDNKIKFHIGVR